MKRKVLLGVGTAILFGCLVACNKTDKTNVEQGLAAIEQLNYDEALTCFETAENAGDTSTEMYRGKGIALMGLVRYEEALDAFTLALKAGGSVPKDIDYDINYYIAVCDYKLERYDEAIERYDAILAMRPKEIDAYIQRGTVRLKNGSYTDAMADFDKAISLDKKNYSLYIDIYCILKENGHATDGESYLQIAMDSNDKSMSEFDKGRLYFYLENYTYARNFLEQAKSKGVKKEELILLLGQSYENLNDKAYAVGVYTGYLDENQSAAVYNQLGLCYFSQENYSEALDAFEKGLALDSTDCRQELLFNQIVAYEHLGEFPKASTLMKAYLEDYPNDLRAQKEDRFLQTR